MVSTSVPLNDVENIYNIIHGIPIGKEAIINLAETISAFNIPYIHPEVAVDHYRNFVRDKIMKEYNTSPEKYHSLYFSVVQSSGYGKSKLLLEAGKSTLHTIYACLRQENSSGYPLMNKDVKTLLNDACRTTEMAELFLSVVYYVAMVILGCFEPVDLPKDILIPKNMHLWELEGWGGTDGKFDGFWKIVKQILSDVPRNILNTLKIKVKEVQSQFTTAAKKGKFRESGGFYEVDGQIFPSEIVVVFDEARFLLNDPNVNLFRNLRYAQGSMGFRNMVLVFVDTISTISNFSPPYRHDPSARPYRVFELLPVFYEVLTYDTLVPDNIDTPRFGELAELFSKGRPVWKAHFFSKAEVVENNIHDSIRFAMVKLSNSPHASLTDNYFGGLAVASIMFGIWGILDHGYASMLLSSYMGTALYFGDDRSRMFVHYVSEPILAEAASQLFYRAAAQPDPSSQEKPVFKAFKNLEFPGPYLKMVLQNFDACIISGLVDAGDIGELVCRMILSFVYAKIHIEKARKSKVLFLFSDPITVASFLDRLICPNYQKYYRKRFNVPCYNLQHNDVAFLRKYGEIAFTSFELLYSITPLTLDQEYLQRAFQHRVAFVGRENQPGCDLVIPVRVTKGPGEKPYYSALIVQIKNFKTPPPLKKRFKAAGMKLTPSYIAPSAMVPLEPYVSIYIELNFKRAATTVPLAAESLEKAKNHFETYGNHIVMIDQASLSFLDKDIKSMLNSLAGKTADYIQQAANKKALKVMCPLRFGID